MKKFIEWLKDNWGEPKTYPNYLLWNIGGMKVTYWNKSKTLKVYTNPRELKTRPSNRSTTYNLKTKSDVRTLKILLDKDRITKLIK